MLVHSLLRNLEQFGNLSNAVAASKITISSVSQLFVFYVSGIAYEIDNKPVFKTKKRLSLFLFRPTLESQRTNWKLPKKKNFRSARTETSFRVKELASFNFCSPLLHRSSFP